MFAKVLESSPIVISGIRTTVADAPRRNRAYSSVGIDDHNPRDVEFVRELLSLVMQLPRHALLSSSKAVMCGACATM